MSTSFEEKTVGKQLSERDTEWMRWAKLNLERKCNPVEVSGILAANGFAHIARQLQLPVDESKAVAAEHRSKARYDFQTSGILVPTIGGKDFRKITGDGLDLYCIENFLTGEECERMCQIVEGHSIPSTITAPDPDRKIRTSSTCHLANVRHDLIDEVDRRISECLGISLDYSEGIQGQVYSVGEEFKPHTDYFEPGTGEYQTHASVRGQRTWTFMIYLNETESGGTTHFPKVGQEFSPVTGMALAWNNLHSDGTPNLNSLHHGKPVSTH